MIRFRRVLDHATDVERRKMAEVQDIFNKAFPGDPLYADKIRELIENRGRLGYDLVLLTAEDGRDRVLGFAFAHYYAEIRFAYLDYIATDPHARRRGIGDAMYEAIREHLARKGARGMFMDVPPDDPAKVSDPARLPVNRARLNFYRRFGALPITGTAYEDPPSDGQTYDPPFLVFDSLGSGKPLSRSDARKAVRTILVKKFGWRPDEPKTKKIVDSFQDDPVRLRQPKHVVPVAPRAADHGRLQPLKVLVAEHHEIHHVRERGYVERPARVDAILRSIGGLPAERCPVRHFDERPIRAVHDADFVSYLAAACAGLGPEETLYPYVFPIRRPERKPRDKGMRAGYYCIDTFTPLSRAAYAAARGAVDCAVSAADWISRGERLVYAVCRPPGHHAERRVFGGFCYFSNAAIAAHRLSEKGKVALLDIDFHHGNGSQDIFYQRDDVLVLSIHGHPKNTYPYFSGYADERGEGPGEGYNRNYPLPDGIDDKRYLEVLAQALREVSRFKPTALVVSLGFDIMQGDPTGSFVVTAHGMHKIGDALGRLGLPTLVVQEGGYSLRNLNRGSRAFFTGLAEGWY